MLKRLLLGAGALLGLAFIAVVAFGLHTWHSRPVNINLFFAREALQFALQSPETLSSLRVLEPLGIRGHNARLDDASLAAGDAAFAKARAARETLLSYRDDRLSEADRMSKRIALSLLDLVVEAEEFRFHNFPLNQMFGVQNGFPSFMESTHQIEGKQDARDYITRLNAVRPKFEQVFEGLNHREDIGVLPPQFVIDKVLVEMRNFVATPAGENILMTSLAEKMVEAELDEAFQQEILAEARASIDETVYPAYERFIAYYEGLDAKVEGNKGAWSLPNGDAYYRLALKFFTTTDMSPQEIHELGLREVDRIQAEILTILAEEGWDVAEGFEAAIRALAKDPRFYYEDSDAGREQILADYQAIIDEISADLGDLFDIQPESGVEVQRVPLFKEPTSPGAYYNPPSMDGSRPGVFYANLYDIEATPKYGMRTLAYHEAVPGHHFQIALAQEEEDLPFFRRLLPFTAYAEGWALYAERLAYEAGFQDDPYDNIGRLQAELFRAVRLVVDTGIHAKRWSREAAIDYMLANTGMAESDVVAEIERYFVLPGQATSYKVGMNRILAMRDRARTALGERFDIREFHKVVLTNGSVPLTILEELVEQWIEERLAADQA
ncbi:MAG: DUF885 domain-containing protein [Pseudomonadota bacterium]